MRFIDAHRLVDRGLTNGGPLWREKPFHVPRTSWRTTHPSLYRAVLGLSDGELERLQRDVAALHRFVCEFEPSFAPLADISRRIDEKARLAMPLIDESPAAGEQSRAHVGIPGKKWKQIESFAAAIPRRRVPAGAVDWCSGKGYLSGRLIARRVASSSTCLELDPALCESGRRLASSSGAPIAFAQFDVLGASPLPPEVAGGAESCHVALHACGTLHRRMLTAAVAASARQIVCAPCCYHKHPPRGAALSSRVQLLSAAASRSRLAPSHDDLKLACTGSVAASRRDQRLRDREMTWRLAFAARHRRALQRVPRTAKHGSTPERPPVDWQAASRLPSVPLRVLSCGSSAEDGGSLEGFEAFCRWGATVESASAPAREGLLEALQSTYTEREAVRCLEIGASRARRLARLELVRYAFQRPLEQWLLLDQCLYLEENGYAVQLRQFCEVSVSPRNLLVLGERCK